MAMTANYRWFYRHPKLLNREMDTKGYNSWIGDMTEQFGRCRMGTIVQRKMYTNKPNVRASIEEERVGWGIRTARKWVITNYQAKCLQQ